MPRVNPDNDILSERNNEGDLTVNPIWFLILLIPVTGLVKGLDIEMAGEYRSEEACLAVAEQMKEIHYKLRDSRSMVALCVPDTLEENETL